MAKRKSRLLFDVLDNLFEAPPQDVPKSPSKSRSAQSSYFGSLLKQKSKSKSWSMPRFDSKRRRGGAAGRGLVYFFGAILLFASVAYYLGHLHGESGFYSNKSTMLRVDAGFAENREDWSDHNAVLAYEIRYIEESYYDIALRMKDLVNLLKQTGYEYVDALNYPGGKATGNGVIRIWVGRAAANSAGEASLEPLARELRNLRLSRDEQPFKLAYVTLFIE